MNDITALTQRMLLDFTKPLETESGDPVKHVCHDVIEYRCARVCVDAATGIVYSSPYVGLKIRNASQYAVLRKFTEEAASAYSDFENGYISDMKCGDRSHEYLMFVKEPANVLALVDEAEAAEKRIAELEARTLTVNLPDGCEHDVMAPVAAFMYEDGYEFDQEDYTAVAGRVRSELETVLRRALRAAGISVKGE